MAATTEALRWCPVVGVWAAAIAVTPDWRIRSALVLPAVLVPLAWWTIGRAGQWPVLFLCAALLLPPLPIALGDSGPHPALAIAALGLVAGAIRPGGWRGRIRPVEVWLVIYALVLAGGAALAGLYSGPRIGALSLARAGLFAISIYLYFYVAHGPGAPARDAGFRTARVLFFAGAVSAAFACVDFYFQFPTPAGFGPQFVWLASDVYRRAQGVFYEASTLGNVCAFFLVMAAVSLARPRSDGPLSRPLALAGAAAFSAALMLSFSRASLLNLAAAGAALVYLHRERLRMGRLALVFIAVAAAASAVVYWALPEITEYYWVRLWGSTEIAATGSVGILSGRIENWSHLLGFLADHPWHAILGVGYKTLPYTNIAGRPVIADNAYLSALVETGLVGLAAMLLLNVAVLRLAFGAARSSNARVSWFGTCVACFWTGQIVQMLSGDLLTYWRVLPLYFWALAEARE